MSRPLNLLQLSWKPLGKGIEVPDELLSRDHDVVTHTVNLYTELAYQRRPSGALHNLRVLWKLRSYCRRHRIDAIVTHRYKPFFVGYLLSWLHPFDAKIAVFHGLDEFDSRYRRLGARLFARGWKLVGVSAAVRDDLVRARFGFSDANTAVIYNAFDIEERSHEMLDRRAARQALNLPEHGLLLGSVGRLAPEKGHRMLVDAFAEADISGATLVLVGDGRERARLERLAHERGVADRIVFTGFIADAYRYMRAFDVFVLPSHSEAFGMVLVEAMAAEVPIIATDSGGCREVVGGDGIIVPKGDPRELAVAMRSLVELPASRRRQIGEQLRRRLVANFTLSRQAHCYASLFSPRRAA